MAIETIACARFDPRRFEGRPIRGRLAGSNSQALGHVYPSRCINRATSRSCRRRSTLLATQLDRGMSSEIAIQGPRIQCLPFACAAPRKVKRSNTGSDAGCNLVPAPRALVVQTGPLDPRRNRRGYCSGHTGTPPSTGQVPASDAISIWSLL